MKDFLFSYENYSKMLDDIVKVGTITDFEEIAENKTKKFIILRHDVEFSPKRALKMAKIEYEKGIQSSYFFQLTNNSYNIISKRNIERVNEIKNMGHKVGLHFHLNGLEDIKIIKERIKREADILSYYLGFPINRFSFHRPPDFVLEQTIEVAGLINAYDSSFFTYTKDATKLDFSKNIKYVADSKWTQWSYTHPYSCPTKEFLDKYDKIQILAHPFVWTESGLGILENLKALLEESKEELIETVGNETKYVKEYVNEL